MVAVCSLDATLPYCQKQLKIRLQPRVTVQLPLGAPAVQDCIFTSICAVCIFLNRASIIWIPLVSCAFSVQRNLNQVVLSSQFLTAQESRKCMTQTNDTALRHRYEGFLLRNAFHVCQIWITFQILYYSLRDLFQHNGLPKLCQSLYFIESRHTHTICEKVNRGFILISPACVYLYHT